MPVIHIPGVGSAIILPTQKWVESDLLYKKRCELEVSGERAKAERIDEVLRLLQNYLAEEGLENITQVPLKKSVKIPNF